MVEVLPLGGGLQNKLWVDSLRGVRALASGVNGCRFAVKKSDIEKVCIGLLFLASSPAYSAVLTTETWDSSDASWVDRDVAEMAVSHSVFGGGSLLGSFALQGVPVPETDAVRADSSSSGGAFAGDYYAGLGTVVGWSFNLYADHVLPSSLQIRFNGNGSTFFRSIVSEVTSIDVWESITVPLTSSLGWFGGTGAQFTNALSNVQYVEMQITRNGSSAQDYYLDNFANISGGGESTAIPEPEGVALFLCGWFLLIMARQFRIRSPPLLHALMRGRIAPDRFQSIPWQNRRFPGPVPKGEHSVIAKRHWLCGACSCNMRASSMREDI